jgi:hypothetical protein
MDELRKWVGDELSPIAKPDDIRLADNLPKTRSGKIMRRLLRAIARGEEISQDVSTLENPAILDQLRGEEGASKAAAPKKTAPPKKKAAAKKPAKGKKAAKKKVAAKKSVAKKKSTKARPRKKAARKN